jgi:hypothetical protein
MLPRYISRLLLLHLPQLRCRLRAAKTPTFPFPTGRRRRALCTEAASRRLFCPAATASATKRRDRRAIIRRPTTTIERQRDPIRRQPSCRLHCFRRRPRTTRSSDSLRTLLAAAACRATQALRNAPAPAFAPPEPTTTTTLFRPAMTTTRPSSWLPRWQSRRRSSLLCSSPSCASSATTASRTPSRRRITRSRRRAFSRHPAPASAG